MKQAEKPNGEQTHTEIQFLFNENMFPGAYIEYTEKRNKKVKSDPSKSGKTLFKWHKIQFHHISVAGNTVDYLIHDGIVINSFPLGKDRNEIYAFLERHWDERIHPFVKYIDARRDSE